jgi:hypothetical protein
MSANETSASSLSEIPIDTAFLLRRCSDLSQVERKRRTWNELGERLLHHFMGGSQALPDDDLHNSTYYWTMAKTLVHSVTATQDPQYNAIRMRLGNLVNPSTPLLLFTLGLWLAGTMGISTSITGPLVAVMLHGVAEAAGDWGALESMGHG